MRHFIIVVALLLSACIPLPEPDPPDQGAYGFVRREYTESQVGIPALRVYAAPATLTLGEVLPDGTPSGITDHNGNFSIALPTGRFRLCLANGSIAALCDCTIEIVSNGRVERGYYKWNEGDDIARWQGEWLDSYALAHCVAE